METQQDYDLAERKRLALRELDSMSHQLSNELHKLGPHVQFLRRQLATDNPRLDLHTLLFTSKNIALSKSMISNASWSMNQSSIRPYPSDLEMRLSTLSKTLLPPSSRISGKLASDDEKTHGSNSSAAIHHDNRYSDVSKVDQANLQEPSSPTVSANPAMMRNFEVTFDTAKDLTESDTKAIEGVIQQVELMSDSISDDEDYSS